MKILKTLLAIGAIALTGGFLLSTNTNDKDDENEQKREEIKEIIENADETTREFIDALLNKEEKSEVCYWNVKSDDGKIDYTLIKAYDKDGKIVIDGSYKDNRGYIFIKNGGQSYSLNLEKNIYIKNNVDNFNADQSTGQNSLSYKEKCIYDALAIEKCFKGKREEVLEKTDYGFKKTIKDDLNYGYYLYDENGDLFETYLENTEGNITTKLIDKSNDIEGTYNQFYSLMENMQEVEDFAAVKEDH